VLVSVTTEVLGNTASTGCLMSFVASGANIVTAVDANAVNLSGQRSERASADSVLGGLSPGSTTFSARYRTDGTGTLSCTYSNRVIVVIPLP
jgi:hypothetical protein